MCGADAAGTEGADPLGHAFAVGDGLGAQQAQVVLVGGTGGADRTRAARDGELDGRAADPDGGAVDEQRAPAGDAEMVKREGGCLDANIIIGRAS